MTRRWWWAIGLTATLVVAAVGAGLLLRPTSYADRDWAALPAVEPRLAEVWEPTPEQLRSLVSVVTCDVLRRVDPTVEQVEQQEGRCRTLPEWDQLQVAVVGDGVADLVDGSPASFAHAGVEREAAGHLVWEVAADGADGHCAAFLPAGATHGLVVTAEAGPLCDELTSRLATVLEAWAGEPPFTPVGEASVRGAGACVDLRSQRAQRCAEHVDRAVPTDPVDAIRQGEADPDVVCAAALAAADEAASGVVVRAVTATPLVPGGARSCVLLVGEREAVIWVRTSRRPVGGPVTATVAGHAERASPYGAPTHAIALDDPAERGQVEVVFDALDGSTGEPAWSTAFLEALVVDLLE